MLVYLNIFLYGPLALDKINGPWISTAHQPKKKQKHKNKTMHFPRYF